MHVVHVVESLEMGGMERAIATLCRTLRARDIRTSVLALKRMGTVAEDLEAEGVPVRLAGVPTSPPDYLAWRHVYPALRRLAPTVVHTHNSAALIYGAPSARLLGVSSIVHTDHGRVLPDRPHIMLAERAAALTLRAFVAVSAPLAQAIQQHLHVSPPKLQVIANGVDVLAGRSDDTIAAMRASWDLGSDGPVVGLAARLVWEKGLDVLLDAWALLAERQPHARLVIAGDGPERAALEAQSARLGLGTRVRFVGMVRDTATFFRAIHVYALPSVSEGLPLALLEAMSIGLPIVASAVGGIPAVLAPSDAGVLVPPRDPGALADALERTVGSLARSDGSATASGARAQRTFEEGYTAAAMTDAYLRLYNRTA